MPISPFSSLYFFDEIEKYLEYFSDEYENSMGDLNCEPTGHVISEFMENSNHTYLDKSQTWFKSGNSKCIDLILSNSKITFKILLQLKPDCLISMLWSLPCLKVGSLGKGLR